MELLGALHAAEHSQIAVLPLLAMCDRWDIGGLSTNLHPQTGGPTIFIYDGHPGGIGITRRGFLAFEALVDDAHRLVSECPCEKGCPSCVQSPKCGNLNEPLSKLGAAQVMGRMLAAGCISPAGSRPTSGGGARRAPTLPVNVPPARPAGDRCSCSPPSPRPPSPRAAAPPRPTRAAARVRAAAAEAAAAARPRLRATIFTVSPGTVELGQRCASPGGSTAPCARVRARVALVPGRRRQADLDRARHAPRRHALRAHLDGRAGRVAAGRYTARLHATGPRGATLRRTARASGG